MASGYFPLDRNEDRVKEINKHLEAIKTIVCEIVEACLEQDQIDNAYYDGKAMGEIELAIELIERNIND